MCLTAKSNKKINRRNFNIIKAEIKEKSRLNSPKVHYNCIVLFLVIRGHLHNKIVSNS